MQKNDLLKILRNSKVKDIELIQDGENWTVKNIVGKSIKPSFRKNFYMTTKELSNLMLSEFDDIDLEFEEINIQLEQINTNFIELNKKIDNIILKK